jgi:hypothetical protein
MMKMTRLASSAAVLLLTASGSVFAQTNNGTSLSVALDAPVVTCREDGLGADVTAAYTVLSTGSADSAVMTATVGATDYALPTIASGNVAGGGGWTFAGRTKSAEGEFGTYLANGSYTLSVCAVQSGANGRISKQACSAATTVNIDCIVPVTDPCALASVRGEVPANKNLCKANGHINVQFEGSFGTTASLVITGPEGSGISLTVPVDRAGESCNYHYNWDPNGLDAAGTYTFDVNGGGLEFSASLYCDAGNGGGKP